ncbi:hypothetical protein SASPL_149020 [Salvia splendens]|uniref:Hemoglobin n=1 Tax=Salvia splendens TaxID=180675 RepID=A0A8X8WAF6_SALSN|nr:hypothetical protein SASPL_149020 [Salvia splendens]
MYTCPYKYPIHFPLPNIHKSQRARERDADPARKGVGLSEWSGVSQNDAFINLSTNFYNRVYDDEEEWFRSIFANSKKEDAIQNQYEFFIQRMGGPPLFSQRRGHPALIGRHRPFPVTHQAAERWLHHMQEALDTTKYIDSDSKTKMMNFFRHTAFFLVAGDELKNPKQGIPCKHAA